jgi:RHS repeat-associated protein
VAHRFFTGKPYVEDLGAVFLFRNYRPELGKWQTSDPLGYPDGWNNFAYVNNWVTNNYDWLGAIARHYLDTEGGISGSGHSAWVFGNNNIGYTAYDYGPISSGSGPGVRTQHFDSLTEAENFLQKRVDTGASAYDKCQEWDTSSTQDNDMINAANNYIGESYEPDYHNCYQLGYDSLTSAGEDIFPRRGTTPIRAFKENNIAGYARTTNISVPE